MACDCDCGKTPEVGADYERRVVFNLTPGTPFPRELETVILELTRKAVRTRGGDVQTVLGR